MPNPPLVGREPAVAAALGQLERAASGSPAALLIRGEAGVGKSRLVLELLERARPDFTLLTGRADDLDAGIPYAVFRDLLARAGTVDGAASLRDAFDAPSEGEDGHVRFVFAAAVSLLRTVAPAVLVLEDLHVADRESLTLTALLARLIDLPVLVVATLRPDHPDIEQLFNQLAVDGRGAVVDLAPLSQSDTAEVVAAVIGATPTGPVTAAVFTASDGNPFFTVEIAQSLLDSGGIRVEAGQALLSVDAPALSLRSNSALLRRLFGGAPADLELAKVMSVFGRFPLRHLPLVSRLTGQSVDDLRGSFDRLVKAGVLVASAGGYEFSHAIVRAALYDDIGPAERRRIHAAIAAALAPEARGGIVLDVLELATHVAESAEPGDEDSARVLVDAGTAAVATAPLVAAGHYRRAAALLPVGSPLRTDALSRQARARHIGSRPAEAAVVGREAMATGSAVPATVALVVNDLYLQGHAADALRVVDEALAAGGDACPLLALQVNLRFQSGRFAEALAGFDAAVASLAGPPASQLMALAHIIQYANHIGRVDVAATLLDRLAALPVGGSPTLALAAHELAAFADWRPGIVARVADHLSAARQLRPDVAGLSIGGTYEAAEMRLHLMRGEWTAALDLARDVAGDLTRWGAVTSVQLLLCAGCHILIDRGDVDEATSMADRLVTPIKTSERDAALVRARLAHAIGNLPAAEQTLQTERAAVSQHGASQWRLAEVLAELAAVLLAQSRHDQAAAVSTELDALAARVDWLECQQPALRVRAAVHGDADSAAEAVTLAEHEGWTVEHARALLQLGELDVDPGPSLTQAYRLFDSFGAAPLRRRAAAGLRSRGLTVPRRAASTTAELTDTEIQLVRLVREGLSNKEIAAAMSYSVKTIEVYLSRVYARAGVTSRLELIRASLE